MNEASCNDRAKVRETIRVAGLDCGQAASSNTDLRATGLLLVLSVGRLTIVIVSVR